MRNTFAKTITQLAAQDPRVVLLSGDIGNRLFDEFKERFPERFYNCGIAEANMIGVAAGLAMSGLRPVAYTIAPFITARCLEQIRIDLCYHRQPVVIVGTGAGLSYASLGATHHCCEDIAQLRTLPQMTVVCPGDPIEVRLALRALLERDGPAYLRIGKKGEPNVHPADPAFQIGHSIVVRGPAAGAVCLLSTGNLLPLAMETAGLLDEQGCTVQVVSYHTVKPLDVERLESAFQRFRVVATMEEHSVLGGLGGAVAEWLADSPPRPARLIRLGTPDRFLHEAGGQAHARGVFDLTAPALARRLIQALDSTWERHESASRHLA